jgi:CRISPR-associated protein Csb2
VTPFTPSFFPKRNADWPAFLHAEVIRELKNRKLPLPRAVTLFDEGWQEWRRYRPSARVRRDPRQGQASRPSAFLRIELAEPIPGPLTLGHLSHFGLGLFTPEPQR